MNSHNNWFHRFQIIILNCLMLLVAVAGTVDAAVFPLTITANNSTKVYGTPVVLVTAPPIPPAVVPLPDYTVTGLQPGDSVNSVTLTSAGTPAAAPVSGSPYTVVPSAAVMTITSGNTYTITYVNGSMTVTPTTPTINPLDPVTNLPIYRKPILMPVSQTGTWTTPANSWPNLVPNALADYFTYVPFKNADAVALGFPASCGNPAAIGATAADLVSTDDCYTLSVRKFPQGLSLPAAWGFGGNGLLDPNAANAPFGAISNVYGYGSGGAGWTPPYVDTSKPGVLPGVMVTGNAPTPFANGTLASTGIWHWPAPTIKGTKGRPVRVQWLNDLINEKPTGFDPTICGTTPSDCFPYNRIVTHVHGAHVGPESDGMVHAWFTPGFVQRGPLWESTRQHGPEGTYYYPMDQEAGTIWYHDHSTGLTHNNTNMGMAGFFPITDANEKLLQANNILPTGIRELGFALQDRIFYQDGQVAMPDAPILNTAAIAAGCTHAPPDPVTGEVLVTSAVGACSPAVPVFMKDPLDGHLIPYPAVPAIPAPAAYLATSATLEFFGNIPVVNGVTYGKYNVDNRVHRMRFIGGTDSRAWILRLKVEGSNPVRYLPFWQIGAEQGLLNNPVKLDHMLIMPGERLDVLVDFSGREVLDATGTTVLDVNGVPAALNLVGSRIVVENWGGDGPYGGELVLPVSNPAAMDFRSADIPEVMVFDVANGGVDTILAPSATTSLRINVPAVPNLTVTPPPITVQKRTVSLVEIVDFYNRIMPTIDGRGFMDYGVSELPSLYATEQWDIINTTVDAHPMHLHQVAFQLINRETIGQTTDLPPACATSVFGPPVCVTPASATIAVPYTPAAVTAYLPNSVELPLPHEIGYKDTIMCPPGKVTRVIATFDIPGTYVWHCHILSHEEHDMMRPMVVTTPATSVTLNASNTSQSATGPMTPVTLTAQAMTGIAAHPVGSGFEYDFAVSGPIHAPQAGLPQPTRTIPMFNSSTGDTFTVVNTANWTPPATAGTYVISVFTKAMGPVGINNPLIGSTMTYTVTNATVAIDPVSLTATYDGTPKLATVLPTTPPGLTVNVTYNGSATPPSAAGTYTVVATIVDATNTNIGTTSATLVINKAPVTITANNLSKGYGTLATYTGTEFTVTGLAVGESISSVTLTSTGDVATANVAGSPYAIVPSNATGIAFSAANYTITYANGSLTVTPAVLTITADNLSKTVNTVNPTLTYTIAGFVNGETAAVLTGTPALSTTAVTNSPVGTYPITAAAGTLAAANYGFMFVNGTFTVNGQVTPTITWATPAAITYGTALSATELNATANVAGTFVYTPALGSILNAGTQALSVTFTPTDTVNYVTATATVNLTVNPAVLTVTANSFSRIINTANPVFTYSLAGFVNGETAAILTGAPALSTTAVTGSPVGSYPITVVAGTLTAANYSFTFVNGILAVTPQLVPVITWAPPAAITYGAALSATQLNATANVAGTFVYTPALGTVPTAGIQALSVSFTPTDTVTYSTATATVNLTVNKAIVTITANNQSKYFSNVNPTLTYITAGFVNGDTAAVLNGTPLLSTTAVTNSPVGTYPITAAVGTLTAANYSFAFVNATLTVNPQLVPVITWATPAAITYGTALSATQLNATASVPGTFVYSRTLGTVLTAGNRAITATFTPTDTVTYSTATATVNLTVNKAVLTVTADNLSKYFSAPNPNLTYVIAGFVNGESAAVLSGTPARSTTAVTNSPVGTYPITVAAGTLTAANYSFTFVNATLTVNPQLVPVITWTTPAAITYGTALSATQLNATANVAGTFAYSPAAGTTPAAGIRALSVTFTPTDGITYSTATATVNLTVNKAVLTVTANNLSRYFSAPNPNLTYVIAGFVNGESAAVLSGTPAMSTTAVTNSPVGTYPITVAAGTLTAANYSFTFVNGTLTVNPKLIPVITWATPAAITYGTALSATQQNATASAPGTFTYTPAAGSIQAVGIRALSVTFTPTDTVTYTSATASINLTVNASQITVKANNTSRAYGSANPVDPGFTIVSGALAQNENIASVSFTYQATASATAAAGTTHTIMPSAAVFGTGTATNYVITYQAGSLSVTQAIPVISWATPAAVVFGSPLSGNVFNATANIPGIFMYSPAVGTILNTSSMPLSVTFMPTDAINYAPASMVVNQATFAGTISVAQIGTAAPHASVQAAYAAAVSGDVIKLLATTLPGPLTFNNPLVTLVTLSGGNDGTFTQVPGSTTTIQGPVTVLQGKVIMNGVKIQ